MSRWSRVECTNGRGPRRARWAAVLLLGALIATAGCGEPDPAESTIDLTRGEFVDVVVALRDAQLAAEVRDSGSTARFEQKRDSILTAYQVTEAELHEFLERNRDLEVMVEIWDSITQRLKRPLAQPGASPATAEDSVEPALEVERTGPTRR